MLVCRLLEPFQVSRHAEHSLRSGRIRINAAVDKAKCRMKHAFSCPASMQVLAGAKRGKASTELPRFCGPNINAPPASDPVAAAAPAHAQCSCALPAAHGGFTVAAAAVAGGAAATSTPAPVPDFMYQLKEQLASKYGWQGSLEQQGWSVQAMWVPVFWHPVHGMQLNGDGVASALGLVRPAAASSGTTLPVAAAPAQVAQAWSSNTVIPAQHVDYAGQYVGINRVGAHQLHSTSQQQAICMNS